MKQAPFTVLDQTAAKICTVCTSSLNYEHGMSVSDNQVVAKTGF